MSLSQSHIENISIIEDQEESLQLPLPLQISHPDTLHHDKLSLVQLTQEL